MPPNIKIFYNFAEETYSTRLYIYYTIYGIKFKKNFHFVQKIITIIFFIV